MSWSYDETELDVALNRVRLKIGDIDATDPQLQDEEVELFIEQSDSDEGAALIAARTLAARYARSVDKWVGDLKILASQRHRAYLELVKGLSVAALIHGIPSAGGIRISQKESHEGDTDLVVPSFRIGMHDALEDETS